VDGREVSLYTLQNLNGLEARIITYGGILVGLKTPDRQGRFDDITLGYDDLESYLEDNPYFGAIAGRYANRIAAGRFTLDGVEYTLHRNNGENHLHGGLKGFDKVVWDSEAFEKESESGLILTYTSPDGEEGYPGTLTCKVVYTLTDLDELKVEYEATTDKSTVVNLTHHSYFNLTGAKRDVLGHELMLNAETYTPVDAGLIPTGEVLEVAGTPMDFTEAKAIGKDLASVEGGYDHNFVLVREGEGLSLAARVVEPESGRVMEITTTEPGIQFYSGNFLDGSNVGKGGVKYIRHYGFCLETQHFPDSPNKPGFPSVVLRPGDTYRHTTVHTFSTVKQVME
jgi:aldose 1-epimerase